MNIIKNVEEPNDIIDAYSYDDMHDSKMEAETIIPGEDDDEDEYMMNIDYDRQYFLYQQNKIPKMGTTTNINFNNKYQRNTETNMFHCVECLLEFKLQRNLVRHMLTHTDDRPFSCHVCLKSFKRKDNLQKHLRDVHAEKQFACSRCDKKFATHRQLCRHNQTRHFTCHVCLKSFKRKDNLQKHLRDVHAENQFACSRCDMKFAKHLQLCLHNETCFHKKN